MVRIIQNLAPLNVAHWTGIFFSFPKHSLRVKFRSLVQILWKLLVYIEGVDCLETNNFHKIWTNDQKKKKIPVQWATFKGPTFWMIQTINIWIFKCLITKKLCLQFFLSWPNALLIASSNIRKCPIWCWLQNHPTFAPGHRVSLSSKQDLHGYSYLGYDWKENLINNWEQKKKINY